MTRFGALHGGFGAAYYTVGQFGEYPMQRRGTRSFLYLGIAATATGVWGCADFDLNRLNPVRYVAGGRTYSEFTRLVAQGQTLASQIHKRKADKVERARAQSEAEAARQRMGDSRVQQLKRSDTKVAVRVNDQDGYMLVDPATGKPVNKIVYTVPPESRNRVASADNLSPPSNQPPESIRRPEEPVSNDSSRPLGNLDDYNVVFAN